MPVDVTQLTPEEVINKYDELLIPEQVEYEDLNSIKTNLIILFSFINIIFVIIKIIKDYIDYLKTQINSENIVVEVIDYLTINKMEFLLDNSIALNIGNPVNINNVLYYVTKTKTNEYEISRSTQNWNVNKLIVQVKLIDGTILYPKIKTFAEKITITTSEPITNNLLVYIV